MLSHYHDCVGAISQSFIIREVGTWLWCSAKQINITFIVFSKDYFRNVTLIFAICEIKTIWSFEIRELLVKNEEF